MAPKPLKWFATSVSVEQLGALSSVSENTLSMRRTEIRARSVLTPFRFLRDGLLRLGDRTADGQRVFRRERSVSCADAYFETTGRVGHPTLHVLGAAAQLTGIRYRAAHRKAARLRPEWRISSRPVAAGQTHGHRNADAGSESHCRRRPPVAECRSREEAAGTLVGSFDRAMIRAALLDFTGVSTIFSNSFCDLWNCAIKSRRYRPTGLACDQAVCARSSLHRDALVGLEPELAHCSGLGSSSRLLKGRAPTSWCRAGSRRRCRWLAAPASSRRRSPCACR